MHTTHSPYSFSLRESRLLAQRGRGRSRPSQRASAETQPQEQTLDVEPRAWGQVTLPTENATLQFLYNGSWYTIDSNVSDEWDEWQTIGFKVTRDENDPKKIWLAFYEGGPIRYTITGAPREEEAGQPQEQTQAFTAREWGHVMLPTENATLQFLYNGTWYQIDRNTPNDYNEWQTIGFRVTRDENDPKKIWMAFYEGGPIRYTITGVPQEQKKKGAAEAFPRAIPRPEQAPEQATYGTLDSELKAAKATLTNLAEFADNQNNKQLTDQIARLGKNLIDLEAQIVHVDAETGRRSILWREFSTTTAAQMQKNIEQIQKLERNLQPEIQQREPLQIRRTNDSRNHNVYHMTVPANAGDVQLRFSGWEEADSQGNYSRYNDTVTVTGESGRSDDYKFITTGYNYDGTRTGAPLYYASWSTNEDGSKSVYVYFYRGHGGGYRPSAQLLYGQGGGQTTHEFTTGSVGGRSERVTPQSERLSSLSSMAADIEAYAVYQENLRIVLQGRNKVIREVHNFIEPRVKPGKILGRARELLINFARNRSDENQKALTDFLSNENNRSRPINIEAFTKELLNRMSAACLRYDTAIEIRNQAMEKNPSLRKRLGSLSPTSDTAPNPSVDDTIPPRGEAST